MPTDKGAHAGAKVAALVAGIVAGADSIEDMDLLRHGVCGSRTSTVVATPRSRRMPVFVDQTAEHFVSPNVGSSVLVRRDGSTGDWRSLITCAVRAMAVVVRLVLGEHSHELPLTEDQHPVEAFAANRAAPPLRVSVSLWRLRWTTQRPQNFHKADYYILGGLVLTGLWWLFGLRPRLARGMAGVRAIDADATTSSGQDTSVKASGR